MFANQLKNAGPIEFSLSAKNYVSDVSTVEAFPARYKEFGGYQFFRGQNSCWNFHHDGRARPLDPRRIDGNYPIAHTADQIHKIVVAMGFGQPYGITHFAFKATFVQTSQCDGCVLS